MSRPISKAQIKFIHALRRDRFENDAGYYDYLLSRYKVMSSKDLTMEQASRFIRHLLGEGSHVNAEPNEFLSMRQNKKIAALLCGIGCGEPNSSASASLVKRICGRAWPQTVGEGQKVLNGLTAMKRRQWSATERG